MTTKIDFMAGLPVPQHPPAGELGIDVGQTWRNRSGHLVTIRECVGGIRFSVERDPETICGSYIVRPNGTRVNHGTDRYDLVERVQRVYIAGPMTGYADLNFPAFHAAAAEYRKRGCFVINPAEMNGGDAEIALSAAMTAVEHQAHWVRCMKKDINALLTCDEIVLLDGWTKSKGATLEHHIARNLGLTINYPVDTFQK